MTLIEPHQPIECGARVIPVIERTETRGDGVEGDPIRMVIVYHALDGTWLAEYDSWKDHNKKR